MLREVFGEFRAPPGCRPPCRRARHAQELAAVRERVRATGEELGTRLRMLVGKPGLDGHSNGAEQVAVRARDVGFEVVYQGIRLTPGADRGRRGCRRRARRRALGPVRLAPVVVPAVVAGLRAAGAVDVPVIVGGIIPPEDADSLLAQGVAAVFTPKDYRLTEMLDAVVDARPGGPRPEALDIRIVIDRTLRGSY